MKRGTAAEGTAVLSGAVAIDGSLLEGGGQILRTSVALSAITGSQIHVSKIRAGRAKPGLSPQHLTGLQLVESISHGRLQGGVIRSSCIDFTPGLPTAGSYMADTRTAGSCTLMVQQALPVLLYATPPAGVSHVILKGGTDAAMAPPIGYLQLVFLPTLQRLLGHAAAGVDLKLVRRGFYPRGGGEAVLKVPSIAAGQTIPAFDVTDRGYLIRIDGYAYTAGRLLPNIGRRIATAAAKEMQQAIKNPDIIFGRSSIHGSCSSSAGDPAGGQRHHGNVPTPVIDIQVVQEPPERFFGDGGGIVLVAQTSTGCLFGSTALAERGVTAEEVGTSAARELLDALVTGTAVDDWMQDQLIIFMALAKGVSSMLCNELTLHTRTGISIVQQLLPGARFTINMLQDRNRDDAQLYMVQCEGAGVQARNKPSTQSVQARSELSTQSSNE